MTASAYSLQGESVPEAFHVQTYARLAGILGIITVIAGGFGEAYVPSKLIVWTDAAATTRNILASESLFRVGFAAYLVEALCDAGLTIAFWVLIRPVNRNLAMAMVVFRIISTCGYASAEMLYFGTLPVLRAAQLPGSGAHQAEALGLAILQVSGFGQALFSMFYGVANILLGWLVYRSGYLPRVLGAAIGIAGLGFALRTFLLVLAPAYASQLLLALFGVAFIPFILWLLIKGVDIPKWRERMHPDHLSSLPHRLPQPEPTRGAEPASYSEGIPTSFGEGVRKDLFTNFTFSFITVLAQSRLRLAYITSLVIAETHRKQGVGRRLLEAIEQWASERGCARISVTSAEHRSTAHAFYPKCGFPYTGRRFTKHLSVVQKTVIQKEET